MGWRWFFAWALPGGAFFLALLTVLSIGIFVAPVAIVLLAVVVRRAALWPEALGALAGVGAVCVAVAVLNWRAQPGGGALDPVPWLVAGTLLATGGVALYAIARRRNLPSPDASSRR